MECDRDFGRGQGNSKARKTSEPANVSTKSSAPYNCYTIFINKTSLMNTSTYWPKTSRMNRLELEAKDRVIAEKDRMIEDQRGRIEVLEGRQHIEADVFILREIRRQEAAEAAGGPGSPGSPNLPAFLYEAPATPQAAVAHAEDAAPSREPFAPHDAAPPARTIKQELKDQEKKETHHMCHSTAGNFRIGPKRGVSYTRSRSRDSGDGWMLRELPSSEVDSEAHRRRNEPQLRGKPKVKVARGRSRVSSWRNRTRDFSLSKPASYHCAIEPLETVDLLLN
ncbi:hypothetical protein B9Z55_027933 [Caenorhabditis nigoni]|nr:hypothetical protein B9Z55_027933 [Caenorhabditis nigoni]